MEAIANAFEKQRQAAKGLGFQIKVKVLALRDFSQFEYFWQHAFLVGGYAASDFLYCSLQLHPAFSEVNLCRPSSQVYVSCRLDFDLLIASSETRPSQMVLYLLMFPPWSLHGHRDIRMV